MQVRILSIDGGGARGIVPAVVLEYIEKKLQELAKNPDVRLSDFIDFISGTAVGTMISCLMTIPSENGRPKNFSDIIDDLFDFSEVYFRKKDKKTLWGRRGAMYKTNKVDKILIDKYDHWKLKELNTPCAFVGYDILNREPVIFTNKNGSEEYIDFFVSDIVRGSGATPGYLSIPSFRDGVNKKIVINGNVVTNNPSLIAYVEANKTPHIIEKFNRLSPENVFILSMGVGKVKLQKYSQEDVKNWGKRKWFTPMLDISIQSRTIITDHQLKSLFKSYKCEENYVRIDPLIQLGNSNIYDTSEKNMRNLYQDAVNYVNNNKQLLDDVALTLFNQDEKYSTMLF